MLVVAGIVFLPPVEPEQNVVAAGAWKVLPDAGLAGRSEPSAVWTRKAMIVWGGEAQTGVRGDGAAFDTVTRTWTPIAPAPLAARTGHRAVWLQNRMVVWGGAAEGGGAAA